MGLLVAIETTSRVTGVALFDGSALVASLEREGRGDMVLPMIDELLAARALAARDVARWAVDVGPGSFTGVRVGVSTVKGIAFATGAEVVAVDAFDALTETGIAILEAGKGEVYFRVPGQAPGHAPLEAVKRSIDAYLSQRPAFGGSAEGRSEPVIGPGVLPRAESVGRVALARAAVDIDRLEPLYVRPPDLTKPK